jgi:hypothetical protein
VKAEEVSAVVRAAAEVKEKAAVAAVAVAVVVEAVRKAAAVGNPLVTQPIIDQFYYKVCN